MNKTYWPYMVVILGYVTGEDGQPRMAVHSGVTIATSQEFALGFELSDFNKDHPNATLFHTSAQPMSQDTTRLVASCL